MSVVNKDRAEEPSLKKRLQKLVRIYDSVSMKIFIAMEGLGEDRSAGHYSPRQKPAWEQFLKRREACRLDVNHHPQLRHRYETFRGLSKERQGKEFHQAMIATVKAKGAEDYFKQIDSNKTPKPADWKGKNFAHDLVKKFDQKLDSWFSSFEAVNVKLSGHVKVSNFVRILTGQADIIGRQDGTTYVVDIQTSHVECPRPIDVVHLCLLKMLAIQNGLESPDRLGLRLLVLHAGPERPVLRLWEYEPTAVVERAIQEGDIDRLIDEGAKSQFHELWPGNCLPADTQAMDSV